MGTVYHCDNPERPKHIYVGFFFKKTLFDSKQLKTALKCCILVKEKEVCGIFPLWMEKPRADSGLPLSNTHRVPVFWFSLTVIPTISGFAMCKAS